MSREKKKYNNEMAKNRKRRNLKRLIGFCGIGVLLLLIIGVVGLALSEKFGGSGYLIGAGIITGVFAFVGLLYLFVTLLTDQR